MGGRGNKKRVPTREEVLEAAATLFEREGPEGLSMRRLAAAVGSSYQVVYSRIGGKSEVARALHDLGFERLASLHLSVPEGSTEHVVALGHHYLSTACAHPALFDLMFASPVMEFVRDDQARAVEWAAFRSTWLAACRAWLEVHFSERPKGASLRLAWRIWTAVHGITVLHLAGHPNPSGDVGLEVEAVIRSALEAARSGPGFGSGKRPASGQDPTARS